MPRLLLMTLALLLTAPGCADDDGKPTNSDGCGALPDRCDCEDWECQYGGCYAPCYCDSETGQWEDVHCDLPPPDAGVDCPNAIASDENCSHCLKDHGAGASYCAAACQIDDDCAGMSSGWGAVPLVCHPDGGYCTRSCEVATDCALGDGVDYSCDDGRCTVCENCF